MLHFALIGEKLGHSLSRPIHEELYRALGIDAEYRAIEIPRDRFDETVTGLLDTLDGFNVTIPYKQTVMPLLDTLDDFAAGIGAVNTVTCRDRSGHNTDAPGFAAMLRYHGIQPAGQPCFVLGNGGASKAVCAALKSMGAASVTLVSRHPGGEIIGYDALAERFSGILVNCTPAGMWPDVTGCPVAPERLPGLLRRAAGVADIIYNPAETVLTRAAKAAGVPACTGLYMLVAQAVEAERLWLGRDIPEDMNALLLKRLTL